MTRMNKNAKRQQLRLMAYCLLAFTLIFTLFGTVLYAQIRSSLYIPLRETMKAGQEFILRLDINEFIARRLDDRDVPRSNEGNGRQGERPDFDPMALSMRVQLVVRDENYEIINPNMLGRLYFEGYLEQIPFSAGHLDQTVSFKLGRSEYLSQSFVKQIQEQTYYVQILANVDAEEAILANFLRMLTVGGAAFVLLSIGASILLTKNAMEPVIKSWNRQTEFVADASHELRTPLTIIQNKLESMLTKPDATVMEKAGDIGVSLAETRRLAKLTADLMTLARADSSDAQLEKESFSLDGLVTRVCEPYVELAEMQEKTAGMDLGCGEETHITADKSRIHQLMVILLDNALKYTAKGDDIRVSTYIRENRAVIEVADTGIGIMDGDFERVFERFYRADKARGRETGGSGLGLSIAKWIVDSHGGSITAQPNSGRGTRFIVRLKLS